ncbi:30S ribosomal protein S21 [Candidatus Saccharibacteria bacterium RIFCSPHIGHO2_12_FULL_47_16b]|nr:MAG: 30S ribosomal protein S21 [Candidatus Saccharibacteria bacterium RIFCSPHIGHO2_12_FULL_47_16b]
MIIVSRKDSNESIENLLRRFSRKVSQSGALSTAKQSQFFEKPISKRDRRRSAISRRARKAEKTRKLKLGR